jgi:hypothetical protein
LNFVYNSLILDLVFADISETCFLIFLVEVFGNIGGSHTWCVCVCEGVGVGEGTGADAADGTGADAADGTGVGEGTSTAGSGATTGTVVGLFTLALVEADGVGDTTTVVFRVCIPLSQSFAK